MNLKFTLLAILLTTLHTSFSMHNARCQMPTTDVLRQRLQPYKTFMQTTDIVKHLAGKELEPLEVVSIVSKAITDYHHDRIFEKKKNNVFASRDLPAVNMTEYLKNCKLTILTLVLKDYPKELAHVRTIITQPSAKL